MMRRRGTPVAAAPNASAMNRYERARNCEPDWIGLRRPVGTPTSPASLSSTAFSGLILAVCLRASTSARHRRRPACDPSIPNFAILGLHARVSSTSRPICGLGELPDLARSRRSPRIRACNVRAEAFWRKARHQWFRVNLPAANTMVSTGAFDAGALFARREVGVGHDNPIPRQLSSPAASSPAQPGQHRTDRLAREIKNAGTEPDLP